MTQTALAGGVVPEWDLADRLTKALRYSGLGVSDMATQLGVSRESVGRWINGRNAPKRAAVVAWASITGCDLYWLENGQDPSTLDRSYLTVLADVVDLAEYRRAS